MKLSATCPSCGSKVIGVFCVECGAETKAPAKRVRVLFDCPESTKIKMQIAAARQGLTIRAFLLEAIAGKLNHPFGEMSDEQIDDEIERGAEVVRRGGNRAPRRRLSSGGSTPGEE